MRFKAWCAQCGHSAACHETRRRCSSCLILLMIAALVAGTVALFGNPRHTATAAADVSASVAAHPPVKD
jgi:hypothetical protein